MGHKKTVLSLRELDPETAISFIRAYHYSKVLPRLNRHFVGFYKDGSCPAWRL